MLNKKLVGLLALSATVALAAGPARAQIMAPPIQPGPMMPPPIQAGPPERVDLYSNAPQVEPGDNPANWSVRQNVVDSDRYERLIQTNPAFRDARIRKECGSINEPELYQQCVATFY
jgi:ABC-type transport system substrate-binding protein